jgi:hypothetical protein
MIWLGVMGLGKGDFVQVWQPVPKWVPAREVLAYLCAVISLASGLGLLWRRTAPIAARVIFASLMVWLLVLRLPNLFFQTPGARAWAAIPEPAASRRESPVPGCAATGF